MSFVVRVSTPSRLHFGLLRLAQDSGPSYGGLGMMINQPRITIELQASNHWQAEGPMSERALSFAKLAADPCDENSSGAIRLRVVEVPPAHSGLGTGTQLALAVARAVRELRRLPPIEAGELAESVGRGRRSAVGSYGFHHGGLVWETGKRSDRSIGMLGKRVAVPDHWRILLFTEPRTAGLYGQREAAAFEKLPPVSSSISLELQRLAESAVLPALEASDFDTFADAVHDYGRLSGSCFTAVQGGSFASPAIERLVEQIRKLGVRGVGQSSWGPTVYAFLPSREAAAEFIERIRATDTELADKATRAAPDNQGAQIDMVSTAAESDTS